MKKIPIIIDTDIGDDIDDVWALISALTIDIFDIKLITVLISDTNYKARLVAKILQQMNKEHIDIAKGISTPGYNFPQEKWLRDFNLNDYKGKISHDFIEEMKNVIEESNEKVTIIALGPLLNINEFLTKYPYLKDKIRIVAMGGAINKGYINQSEPKAEYNVIVSPSAYQNVINIVDDFILVPLDVCRDLIIKDELYKYLLDNESSLPISLILENYRLWNEKYVGGALKFDPNKSSSILYDLGPIFYLLEPSQFDVSKVKINVMNDGSIKQGSGKDVTCLLEINNVNQFYQKMFNYLTSK